MSTSPNVAMSTTPRDVNAAAPANGPARGPYALATVPLVGFLHGILVLAAPISLLHVAHNRLASVGDALLLLSVLSAVYGAASAVIFLLCALPFAALRRPFGRPPGLAVGLFGFHAVFWVLFYEHGLTYDQVPFMQPSSARGMLFFLALAATLIVVVVAFAVAATSAVAARLARSGRLNRVLAGSFALAVSAHIALPFAFAVAPAKRSPAVPAGDHAVTLPATQAPAFDVVLVGVDGADWRVIEPLVARGSLPNFAALTRDGSSARLATIPDANSAVIWASAYTGHAPARHEVLDFYTIQLAGMDHALFPVHRTFFKELAVRLQGVGLATLRPVDRFSLRAHPIWHVLDRAGLSIGVVDGYFYSFPALTPRQPESFVLAYGLDDAVAHGESAEIERFVQPPSLYEAVRPLLGGRDFYWQSATLLHLLQTRPRPRFVSLYTHQPDSVQHRNWKWFEPERFLRVTAAGLQARADAIPRIHRDIDSFLGRLRAVIGPETVLIVFSDHGHAPTITHRMQTQHRHGPPGIFLMAGGPVRRGVRLEHAHVFDVVPTVLHLLGLPVPEDAAGDVLTEALDADFVRGRPPRRIPSYETLWTGDDHEQAPLPAALEDARRHDEIQKLRALGYIR